jgi:ketosteroid isomerase-like protein
MSQENLETVRRAVEAWNRGDMEAYVAFFHPDCEWFSAVARQIEGDGPRRHRSDARTHDDSGQTSGIDVDGPVAYVAENEQGLISKLPAYRDHAEALEAVGLSEQDAHADS